MSESFNHASVLLEPVLLTLSSCSFPMRSMSISSYWLPYFSYTAVVFATSTWAVCLQGLTWPLSSAFDVNTPSSEAIFDRKRKATTVSKQEEHVYQSDRASLGVFIVAVSQMDNLVDHQWHPAAGFYACFKQILVPVSKCDFPVDDWGSAQGLLIVLRPAQEPDSHCPVRAKSRVDKHLHCIASLGLCNTWDSPNLS